jgi:hypothetical protein
MLPIGRSVFRPRLQSSSPVEAFSIAASLAPTPLGAVEIAAGLPVADAEGDADVADAELVAVPAGDWVTLASVEGAKRVSAPAAVQATAARSPVARTSRRARATMDTPVN